MSGALSLHPIHPSFLSCRMMKLVWHQCRREPSFPIAMPGQITDRNLRGILTQLDCVCLSMAGERRNSSSLPLHVPRKTYQLALVICKNTCHTTFMQVLVHIQLLPTFSNALRSKVMDMAFHLSHTCYICLVAFDVKIGYGQTVGRVPYNSHFVGWSKTTKGPRCLG